MQNHTLFRSAHKRCPSAETTIHYMGSSMTFLAEGHETGGRFAMMECLAKSGNEPPPHLHEREDEWLYILEGEIEGHVDGATFRVGPGECLFLPKLKPHAWTILSERTRLLVLVAPAGLDHYFRIMGGEAAQNLELPEEAITYSKDDPDHHARVGAEFGLRFLSPEKAAELFPKYAELASASRLDSIGMNGEQRLSSLVEQDEDGITATSRAR